MRALVRNKPTLLPLVFIAALTLTSCTQDEPAGTPSASTGGAVTDAPEATGAAGDTAFPGDRAVSAQEFWRDHPEDAPGFLGTSTLVLEQAGAGPRTIDLVAPSGASQFTVVLTCDSREAYRVGLTDESGSELSWTAGASCGGPSIGAFTTPQLATPPARAVVDVPSGTAFVLVVYATDGP